MNPPINFWRVFIEITSITTMRAEKETAVILQTTFFMYICEWEILFQMNVSIGSGNALGTMRPQPNTCADVG